MKDRHSLAHFEIRVNKFLFNSKVHISLSLVTLTIQQNIFDPVNMEKQTILWKPRLRLQIQLRLAWPGSCFDNYAINFVYVLGASYERTEPNGAKAEAMDLKRAY